MGPINKENPTGYMNNMAPAAVNPPDQLAETAQPAATPQPDVTSAPTGQPQMGTPSVAAGQNGPDGQPQRTDMKNVPSAQRPHPVAKAFDGILKNISGGGIFVTDPVTGQRREVPQSKSMMAKSIVAAALAGLMTPDRYVDTPFGPRKDVAGGAEAAVGAGMKSRQDREAQAQQLTDDQQARKLFTSQNNMHLATQMAALAHQKFDTLDQQVKYNKESFNKPIDAYMQETGINPYENRGMTDEEVYKSGHRLDDNNVIADDIRMVPDGKGGLEPQPLYSIIRNDFKVNLPEEVTKLFGRFNKPIDNSYQLTGGKVTLPINAYMGMIHTFHTLNDVENSLNRIQKEVNPTAKPIDLSAAYKQNPKAMDAAVNQYEQVLANGIGGKDPDASEWSHVVKAIGSTSAANLLDLVQMQKDQKLGDLAEEHINDVTSARATAKLGGVGPKALAPEGAAQALVDSVNKSALDATKKEAILAQIPEASGGTSTNAQLASAAKSLSQALQQHTDNLNKVGDPAQLDQNANNIIEGDLNTLASMGRQPNNVKLAQQNLIHDFAVKKGLNPVLFSNAALDGRSRMYENYRAGKNGTSEAKQLVSFDAFLRHNAGAVEATKALGNKTFGLSNTPYLNAPLDTVAKQVTNDPDWIAFKTSLIPVRNEIANFLAAGYSPKEQESTDIHTITDPHETPARILAALKQLSMTADDRLASLGRQYTNVMYDNYSNLLSPDSKRFLESQGIKSQSLKYSTVLPKGWQNHELQNLPANLAPLFANAADRDPVAAQELARMNGWKANFGK